MKPWRAPSVGEQVSKRVCRQMLNEEEECFTPPGVPEPFGPHHPPQRGSEEELIPAMESLGRPGGLGDPFVAGAVTGGLGDPAFVTQAVLSGDQSRVSTLVHRCQEVKFSIAYLEVRSQARQVPLCPLEVYQVRQGLYRRRPVFRVYLSNSFSKVCLPECLHRCYLFGRVHREMGQGKWLKAPEPQSS